jgi:osmotically-inducible protein OsmY
MRRFGVGMAIFSIALMAVSWAMADDVEIAREIKNKLKTEQDSGRLQHFDINLQVADGTVLLKGYVASRPQRELVLNAARQIDGVKQVVSELDIQGTDEPQDCEIADAIAQLLANYKQAGRLKGFRISVEVAEGNVTLDGVVADEAQRKLVREAVHSVSGVKRLDDQLTLSDRNANHRIASRNSQQPAETPEIPRLEPQPVPQLALTPARAPRHAEPVRISSDESASQEVENALYHRDEKDIAKLDEQIGKELMSRLQQAKQEGELKGFGIGVNVMGGEVLLKGHVASKEQHTLAIDIARHIPGVKKVINALTITEPSNPVNTAASEAGPGSESESIRIAQLLAARLEQHEAMGRLQGCDFDVRVENSKVILSGYVASPEQQRLVLDVAHRIPGVQAVSADLNLAGDMTRGLAVAPASMQLPVAYSPGHMAADPMAIADQTPRPIGAGRMAAYAGGAILAAPALAMHQIGGGAPAQLPGAGQAVVPARYDHPHLPGYAWPSYSAYPNYAAVTYPKQYSPTAWPYIGPFYPYPQVPLGWRKVTMQWKDGWWQLNFKSK